MSSATERSPSDWMDYAVKAIIQGMCIGLLITLVVVVIGAVLVHFCVVPLAPWCGW